MRPSGIIALVLAAAIAVVTLSSLFTVHQTQQALVLQFGDPRRVISESGLHVKIPFVQEVVYIDKRILDLDSPAEELIASDQKRLVVDAFTRYRIIDPLQFYTSLRNEARAQSRLAATVSSSMRSVLGEEEFQAVVRDKRDELMKRIRDIVNTQAADFGIEIVDVRIRRADLPAANSQAIYRRMQTEREQEAAEFRAKGQEVSRGIRAQADKQVTVLLAEATRDSELIRGEGDRCRNRVFAAVYGQDPDFFAFYRSMQAYEKALDDDDTTFILSPDSAFFRFLKDPNSVLQEGRSGNVKPAKRLDLEAILAGDKGLSTSLCPASTLSDAK
ncbi:MAG: protease modulator HflC [Alphaproteobacteria bacterium]|nr:protease modulator HflC [Alphaproteobacteria bacterium]MBE8220607.1 protease modulator HflC [Alphaproteobacteria bacterium]